MKGYKLIFTDLDGTLLYPDSGSVTVDCKAGKVFFCRKEAK